MRSCKGCGSSTRKLPHPGPRCASCWKAVVKQRRERQHERRVQEEYGLGPGEYEELYQFQNRKCALCQRASGARKRLAVDHDHRTGEVRGLLCSLCNYHVMGRAARDNPSFFSRGIAYLTNPPYRMMLDGDTGSW